MHDKLTLGGSHRNGKLRFFILCEDTLSYYSKHDDDVPKNSIDLSTGWGVREPQDCKLSNWPKEAAAGCAFGIATEERTFYLYGSSANDVRYLYNNYIVMKKQTNINFKHLYLYNIVTIKLVNDDFECELYKIISISN